MNLLLNVPWPPGVSERQACEVLDLCRNSWRAARARAQFCGPINPLRRKRGVAGQPRALSPEQRAEVQKVLTDDQHHDQPPVQVFHSLLERGVYLCSVSTMHRLMRKANLSGERRVQRPPSPQPIPRLLATEPHQVWTWDITKLLGPAKWTYYYLYVILDIYSRYVVGWMLASRESQHLAERLIRETLIKEGIGRDRLTIHSDRGAAMRSQAVAQLLATLGVTKSHSRPHVSDDNPFSESQFKTLK
ncbi:MAG: IS3 family transposase, partial [Betaproteobacteria bacterium]|nr:IS3 family transposase [Betaproteobacteria bacterium]